MGLLAGLVVGGSLFAQNTNISPEISGSSASLQTFGMENRALAREHETLLSQGATAQQIATWREQTAPEFESLQETAQQMSLKSELQPERTVRRVNVPRNASSTLSDFLTTRAELENARVQLRNQMLETLPSNPTEEQIEAVMQQVRQVSQQQHSADWQLQAQRADALGAEPESRPLRLPEPPVMPPNAAPQLQAFIKARNALLKGRAQLWNQYLTADPVTRRAAMQQWRHQNASGLNQLSQLAAALANSTPNQEGNSQ
jgi:hypothetical protein